jgi:hypothetical protein
VTGRLARADLAAFMLPTSESGVYLRQAAVVFIVSSRPNRQKDSHGKQFDVFSGEFTGTPNLSAACLYSGHTPAGILAFCEGSCRAYLRQVIPQL